MNQIQPRPSRLPRMHLSTALLLMISAATGAICFLRESAWIPESKAMTEPELEARFPGWMARPARDRMYSPDGTRLFSAGMMVNLIYDANKPMREARLFDFTIRDYDNPIYFELNWSKEAPIHSACGFIDDNQCVMGWVTSSSEPKPYYRVWTRRYPEWWWGQLYRPEVWLAILLSAFWLWKIAPAFRRAKRMEPFVPESEK